ncbi:5-amino-6-(5-phospho-D-ribitylamino)uracil phosphatase YigB [Vibrio sp. T187]|uniref:5-amino-6-(5-phospho-D-ribitylamino)uracil phosphatase YigB n=1 Tax=Vibrio TaxID=662 RepID=UPI0010C96CC6|nr:MULTISPECIES: 5-amino-6-(5-phospho-D-ribitylamino)uracil phosphatase YigB [Vibrio]MBW3698548.1 5-amino-6-(5-phospho-D-ribitylamino)uracil phosphatase YigB [Vibrio sp. T187]
MKFYRSPQPIKAMTFDLDDTLYDNWPVIARVEREMVKWFHRAHPISASMSFDSWQQVKQQVLEQQPFLKHDVTLWRHTQIKHGLMQLGYSEIQAQQAADDGIGQVLVLRNQIDIPQETHQVLEQLSLAMPLIAITNGNVDPHRIGLACYFQSILKAGPDGRAKPYPDMFLKAKQQLGLPGDAILHVGDHLVTDVQGAKRNGFQACWFNDGKLNLQQHAKATTVPDIEIHRLPELLHLL